MKRNDDYECLGTAAAFFALMFVALSATAYVMALGFLALMRWLGG